MDRSESFRDICEELADAEFALSKVAEAPLAEWQELVDRLVEEVRAAVLNTDAARKSGINPWPPR